MNNIYYNTTYQEEFRKNDCPEDLGSVELFIVPEAQFASYVSQQDADRMAMEYAKSEGQSYANRFGRCCEVYYNQKQEGEFYSSRCEEGTAQEEPIIFEVKEDTVASLYDTEDANFHAMLILEKEGQRKADLEGECKKLYYSEEQHAWFKRKCKPGWEAPERRRSLPAGAATSFISVEDANKKAHDILMKEGEEWVMCNTECSPIDGPCSNNIDFE